MDEIIKILPNYKKYNAYIEDVKNKTNPIMLSGLTDSGKVHFAYSTAFYVEKPICIITYNEMQAKKIIKDLNYFTSEVSYFPKREIIAFDYLAESKDTLYTRINTLNSIYKKQTKIVVTTIEAIMQKIIAKKTLYKNILKLKVGDIINLDDIKEKLVYLGYERCDIVETKSEFSIRGGIIDVALSNTKGIRIELWGDEIDSIRNFDISTQRSTEKKENIEIYPAHEFVLERGLDEITEKIAEINPEEDIENIKNGDYLNKVDKYFSNFYTKQESFLDYIKNDYIIFLDEVSKIKARSENVLKDTNNLIQSIIEKQRQVPNSLEILTGYLEFTNSIKNVQTIYLEKQDIGFVDKQSMHAKRNGYSFSYREVNFFRSSVDLLFEKIQEAIGDKKTITILCGSKENEKKLKLLLEEKLSPKELSYPKLIIKDGSISNGFECFDLEILVISVEEVFSVPQKRKRMSQDFRQGETVIFSDLKPGDYIVHKTNGIGQFVGVNTIKTDKTTKDYIKIKYKDDDILYIPTNNLDNIRKYIGVGDKAPKLNRLRKQRVGTNKRKSKRKFKRGR